MRHRRVTALLASVGLAAVSWLGAVPASADEVWHQAFERASASAACVAPAEQTPWQETFTGQEEWTPSWAQWANGGRGGWVCQRWIGWATSAPSDPSPPSAGCVLVDREPTYVDFGGGWALAYPGWPGVPGHSDAACTLSGDPYPWDLVYAPAGSDPVALCLAAFGSAADLDSWTLGSSGVYGCVRYARPS